MIAPALDTAIVAPPRAGPRGRDHRAIHRRRHLDRMRHSGFPLAGRAVDQEPADPVRRVPGEPGGAQRILAAALRHGRSVRRRPAGTGPSGAGEPLPRRQGAGRDHAEHRQSASSLGDCPATRRRAARQYDLRRMPRLQRALRACLGAPANGRGERLRARLPGLRRLHQDRDRLVRPGDARCRNAARPGSCAVLRSVSGDRLIARGLAGGRISR